MNAKNHLMKLNEYRNRAAAIESDGRFTNAGKQPMIDALLAEMDAQIDRMVGDLEAEYKATRAAFDAVEADKGKARAEWEAGWDYTRLMYAREQVAATVNSARDLSEVEQAYKSAQGDNYKIRVWGEVGADLIGGMHFSEMAGGLIANMKRNAANLTNTPAMLKAQQAEAEVAQRAFDLRADTLGIMETMQTMNRGYKAYQVQELASTIRVKSNGAIGSGYVLEFAGID